MRNGRPCVAVTADAARPDGSTIFGDIGLNRLGTNGLEWFVLPDYTDPVPTEQLDGVDAVLSMGHLTFDTSTFERLPNLRLVARFGAGFDSIDVDAATRAGVVVTTTPLGVRRPVALAALTLVLACAHTLRPKDLMVRSGDWSNRDRLTGHGIDGKTVGVLGMGGIGGEFARLAHGVGFTVIGNNLNGSHPVADELGLRMVDLDTLLRESDYLVITAALTDSARHLIGAPELAQMKPDAYLINIARGPIVDTDALVAALDAKKLGGAALDVFDPEPLPADHPLTQFDNVLLTPHSLPWTEEFAVACGDASVGAVIDFCHGRRPGGMLNPEALDDPRVQTFWAALPGAGTDPAEETR